MTTKKEEMRIEKENAIVEVKKILETTKKRDQWRNGNKSQVPVLYTVLRHVSRSGMSRSIDVYSISENGEKYRLSYYAKVILDLKFDTAHDGLKMIGCGMDMGFALVYNLAYAVYGDGYAIAQEWL